MALLRPVWRPTDVVWSGKLYYNNKEHYAQLTRVELRLSTKEDFSDTATVLRLPQEQEEWYRPEVCEAASSLCFDSPGALLEFRPC